MSTFITHRKVYLNWPQAYWAERAVARNEHFEVYENYTGKKTFFAILRLLLMNRV